MPNEQQKTEPAEHRAFLSDLRAIEALEAEIESRKIRLLDHCGWTRSSAYADCYWRWSKTIKGKVVTTTDADEALRLEERISPCDENCHHED